jgi:hypothetical protein
MKAVLFFGIQENKKPFLKRFLTLIKLPKFTLLIISGLQRILIGLNNISQNCNIML